MIFIFLTVLFYNLIAQPRLEVDGEAEIILGDFYANEAKEGEIRIFNRGDSDLTILAIHKTCGGCVNIAVEPVKIGSGESGRVVLRTIPGELSGHFRKNFFIESNDSKNKLYMISFSGNAKQIARISPSDSLFLGVMGGEINSVERIFYIEALSDGVIFGKESVEGGGAELLRTRTELVEKGLRLVVNVVRGDSGHINCRIRIPVESPTGWAPYEITVVGSFGNMSSRAVSDFSGKSVIVDSGRETIYIEYFFQLGCRECRKVEELIFPELERNFSGRYRLDRFDVSERENMIRLLGIRERLSSKGRNGAACLVIDGRYILDGYSEIEKKLIALLNNRVREIDGGKKLSDEFYGSSRISDEELAATYGRSLTLWMVILGGLADGINPCVFSALVFFMSVLILSGMKGRDLFLVGAVYCIVSFLTYFLIGFGVFRLIRSLSILGKTVEIFHFTMGLILVIFAYLSFRDALIFYRTGRGDLVLLKLPSFLSERIRAVMKVGIRKSNVLLGAGVIGFTATIIEIPCTGQIYLPVLVLLAKDYGNFFRYFFLLFLYNLMFILPLIAIFAATLYGTSSSRLLEWSRKNLVWAKILMGLFFLLLAAALFI